MFFFEIQIFYVFSSKLWDQIQVNLYQFQVWVQIWKHWWQSNKRFKMFGMVSRKTLKVDAHCLQYHPCLFRFSANSLDQKHSKLYPTKSWKAYQPLTKIQGNRYFLNPHILQNKCRKTIGWKHPITLDFHYTNTTYNDIRLTHILKSMF